MEYRNKKITEWILFILALCVILFPQYFRIVYSVDFWKALYTGRYLSLFEQFAHHSTFSYSPVRDVLPRDPFNWFGNVIFYELYEIGGIPTVQLIRIFIGLFFVVICHSIAQFRINPFILLTIVMGSLGINQKLHLRTAIFAVPMTVLLFWFWNQCYTNSDPRWLWAFLPFFVLWGNMHGSYIVGIGLFGAIVIGNVLDDWRDRNLAWFGWSGKLIACLVLVLLAVTFVKPRPDYQLLRAADGLRKTAQEMITSESNQSSSTTKEKSGSNKGKNKTIRKSVKSTNISADFQTTVSDQNIQESIVNSINQINKIIRNSVTEGILRSVIKGKMKVRSSEFSSPFNNLHHIYVAVGFMIGIIGLALFFLSSNPVRFSLLIPFISALILGTLFLRTVPYIALTTVPIGLMKYRLDDFREITIGPVPRTVAVVSILLLAGTIIHNSYKGTLHDVYGGSLHEMGWGTLATRDSRLPRYILKDYKDDRFFNHYNSGGHLIWNWWPYKRVFIDSKSTAYEMSFRLDYATKSMSDLIKKFKIDHVFLPVFNRANFVKFIPDKDWALIGIDQGYMAFRKVKTPHYVEPLDVLMIPPGQFKKRERIFQLATRALIEFIDDFQNVAK